MDSTGATSLAQWQNNWFEANERNVALNKELDRLRAEMEAAKIQRTALEKSHGQLFDEFAESRRVIDALRAQAPDAEIALAASRTWIECLYAVGALCAYYSRHVQPAADHETEWRDKLDETFRHVCESCGHENGTPASLRAAIVEAAERVAQQ